MLPTVNGFCPCRNPREIMCRWKISLFNCISVMYANISLTTEVTFPVLKTCPTRRKENYRLSDVIRDCPTTSKRYLYPSPSHRHTFNSTLESNLIVWSVILRLLQTFVGLLLPNFRFSFSTKLKFIRQYFLKIENRILKRARVTGKK